MSTLTYTRRRAGDGLERLVADHQNLVRRIAWHVHGRVASTIDVADLVQIGMVALVEAARTYEDRGNSFATYAAVRVRGAMIDHLRRAATLSRSAMAHRRELARVRAALTQQLLRDPNAVEMATGMGLDPASYHKLVSDSEPAREETIDEVYSDHSPWFAEAGERADDAIEREQLSALLSDHIGALPDREQMVLQLYFVEELNLQEIGATLGIGAARVCQIKKAALERLRARLEPHVS